MNIAKEDINNTHAVIRIKIAPEDWKPKVDKTLKDYRKSANIPGFRPGQVPISIIQKRYGKAVLVEEINTLLSDNLSKYIKENELRVVGEPLPIENKVDLDKEVEHEFGFEVGIVPDFSVPLSADHKFTLLLPEIEESLIDEYTEELTNRHGIVSSPEASVENDLLGGDFVELDEKGEVLAGGLFKPSVINIRKVGDEFKSKFIGKAAGDKIELKLAELSKDAAELASMFNISKEAAEKLTGTFQFTITQIHHIVPAEINQELWDKIYGPGKVNNSEDFRKNLKLELMTIFAPKGERKLNNEMVDHLIKNTAIVLPDEFLKKWLTHMTKEPLTEAQLNMEYEAYTQSLKWRLIEDKVYKDHNITVTPEEVQEYAHQLAHRYMGHGVPHEQIDMASKRLLQDEKEVNRMYERLYESKLLDLLRKTYTIETKEIKRDEYDKLTESTKN
jgi:trigger factor